MQTTAQTEHLEIIGRMIAATTVEEMAAAVTHFVDTERGRGWHDDEAPGHYFNGHLFVTIAGDNSRSYTDLHALPHETVTLWSQATVERTTRERGRPEIGRPIQVRLPQRTLTVLHRYAEREEISRSEAIRRLIDIAIVAEHRAENLAKAVDTGFPGGTTRIV